MGGHGKKTLGERRFLLSGVKTKQKKEYRMNVYTFLWLPRLLLRRSFLLSRSYEAYPRTDTMGKDSFEVPFGWRLFSPKCWLELAVDNQGENGVVDCTSFPPLSVCGSSPLDGQRIPNENRHTIHTIQTKKEGRVIDSKHENGRKEIMIFSNALSM